MSLNRNVSLATGLRYKGQGPMLTFVLHRISGMGMAIFVTVHILASFMTTSELAAGAFLNSIYEHWAFQLFIFFCALFHSINGLRITILDLFPGLLAHLREAVWVEWAVFIPLYAFAVLVILTTALGG